MVPQHRVLTLAFLRAAPDDHWANRLTARASRHPYCHVELYFENVNQSFSILWDETAGFREKQLSNPNYDLISLLVSPKEHDDCLHFCQAAANQGLRFDSTGMWCSWFEPASPCCGACDSSSGARGSTFCSKIITEALRFAGVREVDGLRPAASTPSRLYSRVRGSQRVACNSVPYKRQALMVLSSMA